MPYDLITAREDIKDRQFTQEFRFASPEGSGPLKWLGGLYLYKKHQDHTLDLNYGQGAADMGMVPMAMTNAADSDIKTYGYAVFGQATYTPVSYTHLDVYKRQSTNCSTPTTAWCSASRGNCPKRP